MKQLQQFNTRLTLEGPNLILKPLLADDFNRLYQTASDPEIWAMHPANDRYKESVFRDFFDSGLASEMAFIVICKDNQQVIGSSRYNNPDYENSSIEIGWTFLACNYWGGKWNAELKNLMLRHAFATFRKVHFCIGKNNFRSIGAVKKLGACLDPDMIDNSRLASVFYKLTEDTYTGFKV